DSQPPANTRNNVLALNAFLDMKPVPTLPHSPAAGQPPETQTENPEARSSAERGPEALPSAVQEDKVSVAPEGSLRSVGDGTARVEGVEPHDHRCWAEMLNSLLVAVSISAVYILRRTSRACR